MIEDNEKKCIAIGISIDFDENESVEENISRAQSILKNAAFLGIQYGMEGIHPNGNPAIDVDAWFLFETPENDANAKKFFDECVAMDLNPKVADKPIYIPFKVSGKA